MYVGVCSFYSFGLLWIDSFVCTTFTFQFLRQGRSPKMLYGTANSLTTAKCCGSLHKLLRAWWASASPGHQSWDMEVSSASAQHQSVEHCDTVCVCVCVCVCVWWPDLYVRPPIRKPISTQPVWRRRQGQLWHLPWSGRLPRKTPQQVTRQMESKPSVVMEYNGKLKMPVCRSLKTV